MGKFWRIGTDIFESFIHGSIFGASFLMILDGPKWVDFWGLFFDDFGRSKTGRFSGPLFWRFWTVQNGSIFGASFLMILDGPKRADFRGLFFDDFGRSKTGRFLGPLFWWFWTVQNGPIFGVSFLMILDGQKGAIFERSNTVILKGLKLADFKRLKRCV